MLLTGFVCSMDKPKGGRGKRAPYESTHVRVPLPIKHRVEELIDVYRFGGTAALEQADELTREDHRLANEYKTKLLTGNAQEVNPSHNSLTSIDEALDAAKKILRSKQSKTLSIAKLLTTIYKVEVTESDLLD
jgi:hypothetical protein